MCEIMRQSTVAASANYLKTPQRPTISLSCKPMADRVTKNGGFTAPAGSADSDSASVDTLLQGVLGGDVQSAKARAPNRARQETAPGLSVIIDEEPPMGGRRRAFLPEEEQVARMAPTIPSDLREREFPRDTVVAGPPGAAASDRRAGLAWPVTLLVLVLAAVAVMGLWWGFHSAQEARRAADEAASAVAERKLTPLLASAAAGASTNAPATTPSTSAPASAAFSALPLAAPSVASPNGAPSSTYSHLVPGGRH